MQNHPNQANAAREGLFYFLGVLLIAAFVGLYFPRFLGVEMVPPAIRFLYMAGPGWAIGVNAGVFILFLVFLPYRTRVEWQSKGAFAAFILALMAEMFGIPLLLYILSPLMRISYYAKHEGGWLNNPLIFGWPGAVIGAWLTVLGLLLVIAGWHQIHRARGLVTTGIYRYVRHPQYLGFFLILTGWLLHWETTLTLIMYPFLLAMYYFLARREDVELKKEFGAGYEEYALSTPMFFPRPGISRTKSHPGK